MGEGMGEGTGGGMGGGMGEGTGEDCGWRGGVAAWRVVSLACSRPLREAQLRATKTAEARRAAASKRRPLAFHTTGAEPHMAIDERRKYVTGTCDAARLGLRLGFGVGVRVRVRVRVRVSDGLLRCGESREHRGVNLP